MDGLTNVGRTYKKNDGSVVEIILLVVLGYWGHRSWAGKLWRERWRMERIEFKCVSSGHHRVSGHLVPGSTVTLPETWIWPTLELERAITPVEVEACGIE